MLVVIELQLFVGRFLTPKYKLCAPELVTRIVLLIAQSKLNTKVNTNEWDTN